jgi:hypothetical protein
MKIIIGKVEIEEAVQCYLKQQGLDVEQCDLDIKMIVGRTDDARIEVELIKNKTTEQDIPSGPVARDVEEDIKSSGPFSS